MKEGQKAEKLCPMTRSQCLKEQCLWYRRDLHPKAKMDDNPCAIPAMARINTLMLGGLKWDKDQLEPVHAGAAITPEGTFCPLFNQEGQCDNCLWQTSNAGEHAFIKSKGCAVTLAATAFTALNLRFIGLPYL